MTSIKRAMQVQNNIATSIILVDASDNPGTYGAFWAPNDDIQLGWELQSGVWVDPTPLPAVEPELTAAQIAAALAN